MLLMFSVNSSQGSLLKLQHTETRFGENVLEQENLPKESLPLSEPNLNSLSVIPVGAFQAVSWVLFYIVSTGINGQNSYCQGKITTLKGKQKYAGFRVYMKGCANLFFPNRTQAVEAYMTIAYCTQFTIT